METLHAMKCECPERGLVPPFMESQYLDEEKPGMNHEPGQCQGTYDVRQYRRGERTLWLCSCCHFHGDQWKYKTLHVEAVAFADETWGVFHRFMQDHGVSVDG